jgi:hypothetical protein
MARPRLAAYFTAEQGGRASKLKEPAMHTHQKSSAAVAVIGIDIGKNTFHLVGLDKHTTSWSAFTRAHLAVLAGTDFFTVEVLTLRGLVTYYVLFFIHLESRKVDIRGSDNVEANERSPAS